VESSTRQDYIHASISRPNNAQPRISKETILILSNLRRPTTGISEI
jgi:hypothetical protein